MYISPCKIKTTILLRENRSIDISGNIAILPLSCYRAIQFLAYDLYINSVARQDFHSGRMFLIDYTFCYLIRYAIRRDNVIKQSFKCVVCVPASSYKIDILTYLCLITCFYLKFLRTIPR